MPTTTTTTAPAEASTAATERRRSRRRAVSRSCSKEGGTTWSPRLRSWSSSDMAGLLLPVVE